MCTVGPLWCLGGAAEWGSRWGIDLCGALGGAAVVARVPHGRLAPCGIREPPEDLGHPVRTGPLEPLPLLGE